MNLTKNPTIDDLKKLLATKEDTAGDHVIWTDNHGEVHIDTLPEDKGPGWISTMPMFRLRYETLARENGYVGEQAAKDKNWTEALFATLTRDWKNRLTGYSDDIHP